MCNILRDETDEYAFIHKRLAKQPVASNALSTRGESEGRPEASPRLSQPTLVGRSETAHQGTAGRGRSETAPAANRPNTEHSSREHKVEQRSLRNCTQLVPHQASVQEQSVRQWSGGSAAASSGGRRRPTDPTVGEQPPRERNVSRGLRSTESTQRRKEHRTAKRRQARANHRKVRSSPTQAPKGAQEPSRNKPIDRKRPKLPLGKIVKMSSRRHEKGKSGTKVKVLGS